MTSIGINAALVGHGVGFQSGGGKRLEQAKTVAQSVSAANKFAKDRKLVTHARQFTDSVGLTSLFDKKSNGLYSTATDKGISLGYGKKKTRKRKAKK